MMSKYNQNRFQKPIPVKEGETYEVTIESIGTKGDGIAKIDGYVVIVPQAQKGEHLKVKINAIRGKVSFGEIVESLGEADQTSEDSTNEQEMTEEADSTEEKPKDESEETSEDEPKEDSTEEKPSEETTEGDSEEEPKEDSAEEKPSEETTTDVPEEEPKEDSKEDKKEE